ncbi:hypothetical protein OE88DRAFT_1663308 [Heliocybe sulcata]|uniref:Signal peptidase complex subunit 2 n=1 Tax=Heliocybe sulcata TaxID=5364 RepID=A0A5C3MVK7_9AGAM|nr:hypothetical protein OE88DRAFT_1663308 [Heliocybe sulcata]
MAKTRKAVNGDAADPSSSQQPDSGDSLRPATRLVNVVIPASQRDVIKVNNANLVDLKNACDDILKRFLSRPELFKQINTHTDVRLALGWASVLVAAGTAYYGWKVEFEASKPVVWTGMIVYVILSITQTLYAYLVEKDIVFVGKRKTFDKRIVTERIALTSNTTPSSPSKPPSYSLSATYVRSASGGKSLLGKGKSQASRGYNEFFDVNGTMDQERFESWVTELVEKVMQDKTQ